ncbi:MAG: rhodanese-like domain-containing protein [Dermatophilus congolensis]|nr:rhodanese-like domain-containing protein [Dermatophilus congolensis]
MTVPTGAADTSSLPVAGVALPANGAAVDAATFAAAMQVPGTVILDVRTPQEFAQGHIEGAFNIDIESGNFADKVAELDTRVPYAIYCRSGNRSAVAVQQMNSIGFTQTYHLEGGITAWQSSGHPVVK